MDDKGRCHRLSSIVYRRRRARRRAKRCILRRCDSFCEGVAVVSLEPVTRYESDGGARIYRIPVRVFQMLVANVYIVIAGDYVALVDTGSGLGESDDHIRSGIEQI